MIALLFAIAAAPIVDARTELPWQVSVEAGTGIGAVNGPCGPRRILGGTSTTTLQPLPATSSSPPATFVVPLFWQAGLFGLDGDLVVVAAEAALRAAKIPGTVTLRLSAKQAAIAVAVPSTTSAPAVSAALSALATDGRQFSTLLQAANARRAWRHSRVGAAALDVVDAGLCFPGATVSTTTTTQTPATLRAALGGPVLPAS